MKRAIASTFIVALAVAAVFAAYWRPALAPIDPDSVGPFSDVLIDHGRVLATAGNCETCHTAPEGTPLAGGRAVPTPFGAIYSTNLTPDPFTGIGLWSEQAFARALHEGVSLDGSNLFPAFPFDHFTGLTASDVRALYAYFMTRRPVVRVTPENTLPFPLNVRALQAGWKLLFFRPGPYQPDASQDADWNRGAYLAESLAHCGSCHTPRDPLGAERAGKTYAGTPFGDWFAPALTSANTAPLPWTQAELYRFLRRGATALHGEAVGPMSDVVHDGLSALPDADIRAMAKYFAAIDQSGAAADSAVVIATALHRSDLGVHQPSDPGAIIYTAACAGCHYNSGTTPALLRPELALNSALTVPTPTNFIEVVLNGIGRDEGMAGVTMPGYASALTDDDIAALAAYLRRTRTDRPPWRKLVPTIAKIRHTRPSS